MAGNRGGMTRTSGLAMSDTFLVLSIACAAAGVGTGAGFQYLGSAGSGGPEPSAAVAETAEAPETVPVVERDGARWAIDLGTGTVSYCESAEGAAVWLQSHQPGARVVAIAKKGLTFGEWSRFPKAAVKAGLRPMAGLRGES